MALRFQVNFRMHPFEIECAFGFEVKLTANSFSVQIGKERFDNGFVMFTNEPTDIVVERPC